MRTIAVFIFFSVSFMPAPAAHQHQPPGDRDDGALHLATSLVSIPVSVTDRAGRYVADLRKDDFRLFEDGREQPIAFFSPVETPFVVALVVDASPSTMPVLNRLIEATNLFMNRLRPDDKFLLLLFDRKIHEMIQATRMADLRPKQINYHPVCCGTSLYDAVDFILAKPFKHVAARKAVILFTDGVDTASRATDEATLRRAEEADIAIYPICFNTYVKREIPEELKKFYKGVWPEDYARGEAYLRALAQMTGGRMQSGGRSEELWQAFGAIAEELGRQYSLAYYPEPAAAAERRKIKVLVRRPDLAVRARASYIYVPAAHKPQKP